MRLCSFSPCVTLAWGNLLENIHLRSARKVPDAGRGERRLGRMLPARVVGSGTILRALLHLSSHLPGPLGR